MRQLANGLKQNPYLKTLCPLNKELSCFICANTSDKSPCHFQMPLSSKIVSNYSWDFLMCTNTCPKSLSKILHNVEIPRYNKRPVFKCDTDPSHNKVFDNYRHSQSRISKTDHKVLTKTGTPNFVGNIFLGVRNIAKYMRSTGGKCLSSPMLGVTEWEDTS